MRVFCVLSGEKNEGGGLESVHRTHEGAVKAALEIKPCFPGGWVESKDDADVWYNGCDFVEVVVRDVEE